MQEQKRGKRYRTFRLPPEPLPAYDLLDGADDPLAEILFRALVEFRRWTSASAPDRLVARGNAGEMENLKYILTRSPELEEPLGCYATLRRNPGLISVGAVARACEMIHSWADERGLELTALLFAEAWAGVDPDNPIANNAAGRMARHLNDVERAEIWFERAYKLAARKRNRREKIKALIYHGGMLRECGQYAEARQKFEDAAKLAGSTRRKRQAAEVQHELFTIAAESGDFPEAEVYLRGALRVYPIHHRAIPWLAHDWAFLLVRSGFYMEAKVLLLAVTQLVSRKQLQVVIWGTLGRAAAGTNDRRLFERSVERVISLVGAYEEFGAAALAHLAVGWQFFGEWDAAAEFAQRSIQLAQVRLQPDVERGAQEILASSRDRIPPQPQTEVPPRSRIPVIEKRLLQRLVDWTKPRRREVVKDPEAGGRRSAPNPREGQPTGPGMDSQAE
jgi:tetratricopeptide (TPR) repeat protein